MPYVPTFKVLGPGDDVSVVRHVNAARHLLMDAIIQLDDTLYLVPREASVALQGIRHDIEDARATLQAMLRWESAK